MGKRRKYLQNRVGTVHPHEYNWEEQFDDLDPSDGFVSLDVGKVYGLAMAYREALENLARKRDLLFDIHERLKHTTMCAPEDPLLTRLIEEQRT